eukprot:732403-Lingulodinium_polyedra.AAC.1
MVDADGKRRYWLEQMRGELALQDDAIAACKAAVTDAEGNVTGLIKSARNMEVPSASGCVRRAPSQRTTLMGPERN